MKNKGFTLAELLAVIVIIALIMVVGTQGVLGIQKAAKETMFCTKVSNIESAAKLYGKDFIDEIKSKGRIYVSVEELIENSLYKKENNNCSYDSIDNPCVKDPRDNKSMDKNILTITLKYDKISAYFAFLNDSDAELCEGKKDEAERSGTYIITLDNQGATTPGSPEELEVIFGDKFSIEVVPKKEFIANFNDEDQRTVINNRSVKVSHKFLGYFKTINPGSTKYINENGTNSKTLTTPGDRVLYAQWQYNSIVLSTASRVGHTFNGWYTAPTGGTKVGDANANYILKSNMDLYAHFTPNNYQVTLDNRGATSSSSTSVTATYDKKIPTITIPSRTGYTFGGYFTAVNGGGTKYIGSNGAGTKDWDIANNATLYAYWIPNKYTITLNNQSATNPGTRQITATYDAALPNISIPSKSYTITFNYNGNGQGNTYSTLNYNFAGYYTDLSGRGTQYYYSNGTGIRNWNTTSNTTLYANWSGGQITLPNPSRSGYTFLGWYTESSGGTKVGNGGGTYSTNSNRTLYAQWSKEYIDIAFDFRGSNNAFNHLGYSLVPKSNNIYNVQKNGQVVSSLSIPSTYTYNNQKYKIISIGGSHGTVTDHIVDLTSITIPSTIKNIDTSAFQNFDSLKTFTIPSSVTTISDYAFAGSGLTKIVIPTGVSSIGVSAFQGCSNLSKVYIESTNIRFGKYCFRDLAFRDSGTFGSWIYVRKDEYIDTLNSTNIVDDSNGRRSDYVTSISYKKNGRYTDEIYYTNFYPFLNWKAGQ